MLSLLIGLRHRERTLGEEQGREKADYKGCIRHASISSILDKPNLNLNSSMFANVLTCEYGYIKVSSDSRQ